MKRIILAGLALTILTGFGGCGTPATPQNVEQGVAYGYPTHAVTTQGVNEACKQGKLTLETCENALTVSKQVKISLDLAQTLVRQGKPTDAQATLKMALSSLEGLQKLVEESKK